MRLIINMLRVPNLLIIALTFYVLRYLVFFPVYREYSVLPGMTSVLYLLLVVSTILIAASGYISNDCFDVRSDRINKPGKHYIGELVKPGQALSMAILLSAFAIVLAILISVIMTNWLPAFLLFLATGVAWWYAVSLKRSFIWGNIAVSCMTAGTIAMAWLIENQFVKGPDEAIEKITGIVTAISIFAFLLSLLREIVKDTEDIEGDLLIHCRSIPIVKGIAFTKSVLAILAAITVSMLLITQINLAQASKTAAVVCLAIVVELPLVIFIIKLRKAISKTDYHRLSQLLKWIMVGGLLSIAAYNL